MLQRCAHILISRRWPGSPGCRAVSSDACGAERRSCRRAAAAVSISTAAIQPCSARSRSRDAARAASIFGRRHDFQDFPKKLLDHVKPSILPSGIRIAEMALGRNPIGCLDMEPRANYRSVLVDIGK